MTRKKARGLSSGNGIQRVMDSLEIGSRKLENLFEDGPGSAWVEQGRKFIKYELDDRGIVTGVSECRETIESGMRGFGSAIINKEGNRAIGIIRPGSAYDLFAEGFKHKCNIAIGGANVMFYTPNNQ